MTLSTHIKRFSQDEDGVLLVFWGMCLVVIFGLVALSFDFGRVASTQSELQSYADTVALAAAAELDGNDDAITRSTGAAQSLIADTQTFGTGSQSLGSSTDFTLTFFSTLPASDLTSLSTGQTTDPAKAAYVRVVATPRVVGFTFANVFYGLSGQTPANNTVGATAVAGFTQYACDVTPLMFCLPNNNYKADENIGDMILLRSGGQGAAWGPGDFGFLDPQKIAVDDKGPCAGLSGQKLDSCLIGAEGSITQCFAQRGVDTEPGQKVGIEDAIFNIRFDIYRATMNGKKNDPLYPPAPNVIKGIVPNGGQCIGGNEQPSPDTVGLPRDTCFTNGTCGRYGDGNWATGRTNYVNVNYGGVDPHPGATTRYQYYLAEIAAAGGAGSSSPILSGLAENGRPQCSANQSNDPERRVVVAAAVDCNANPVSGKTTNIPVKEFFRMFLTEPVGKDGASPPNLDLWVEVVGSAGGVGSGSGGYGGIFHDVVQLYR